MACGESTAEAKSSLTNMKGHRPGPSFGDEVEDDGVQLVDGGSKVVVDDGLVEIARRLAESDFILGRGEPALKRLFRLGPTTTQATLRDG